LPKKEKKVSFVYLRVDRMYIVTSKSLLVYQLSIDSGFFNLLTTYPLDFHFISGLMVDNCFYLGGRRGLCVI
jgi:hypothetical protein